jgi:hypothetical protein
MYVDTGANDFTIVGFIANANRQEKRESGVNKKRKDDIYLKIICL